LAGNQRDRKRRKRSLKKVCTPIRKLRKRVYLCTPETTTRLINEGKKRIKFFEDIEATTT
jgi:hypothetical protein